MPTGYTSGVQDGTVTDFVEFGLICARAFGATIMLRDDPLSSDIPQFEPSDYHAKALADDEAELLRITLLSVADATAEAVRERDDELARRERSRLVKAQQKERYERMLERARRFKAPTAEHKSFAEFLVSQLVESIEWDCSDTSKYESPLPSADGHEWRCNKLATLQHSIERHKKDHTEEIKRTKLRNEWVQQLREALKGTN